MFVRLCLVCFDIYTTLADIVMFMLPGDIPSYQPIRAQSQSYQPIRGEHVDVSEVWEASVLRRAETVSGL